MPTALEPGAGPRRAAGDDGAAAAQRRADRILAFRDELSALEGDGVLTLPADAAGRVRAHHDRILDQLAGSWDVARSGTDRQLSWGMRIASTLGALALAASIVFYFHHVWGHLAPVAQVAILAAAPLLLLAATVPVSRRDPGGHFTTLVALLAWAAFVLELAVLGQLFAITPSPWAFVAWGGAAYLLAAAHGLRLLAACGAVTSIAGFAGLAAAMLCGWWEMAGERPETWILGGLVLGLVTAVPAAGVPFRSTSRFWAAFAGLAGLYVTALSGASLLPISEDAVSRLYELGGFLAAAAVIAVGIRLAESSLANLGTVAFVVFLVTKLVDWWWEWMPKYLFFLLVGLIAVGLLVGLRRLRDALAPAEVPA